MFFTTKDNIPDGLGFSTFGTAHILWLLFLTAFCVTALFLYKKLSEKGKRIMLVTVGLLIVLMETAKDVVAAIVGEFGVGHLPFHLCGINILLIAFDLIKPVKTVRNFLYYFCIPGALLALLFPNWTALPQFNFWNIHSFVIHALLALYPLLLTFGGFKPEIKMMPKSILLLIGLAIPVYFINLAFNTNFMFLMNPETGNPLGLFEKYMGSHLFGFPILLPIVMFIMYTPFLFIKKKKLQL